MKHISLLGFIFLLVACASEPIEVTRIVEKEIEVTRIVEIEITREILVTLTASPEDAQNCDSYLVDVSDLSQRWEDSLEIADNTARINLSDRVAELNELRQEARDLETPECASGLELNKRMISMMNSAIDLFNNFMVDESTSVDRALYNMHLELYFDSLNALKSGANDVTDRIHYFAAGVTDYFFEYIDENSEAVAFPRPGAKNSVEDSPSLISVQYLEGNTYGMEVSNPTDGTGDLFCIIYLNGEQVAGEQDRRQVACEFP